MIQDLEAIEYHRGIIESGMKTTDLPVKVWCGAKIPAVIRKALIEEDILNLGGIYGNKNLGYPMEYDHLKLTLTDDVVEIEFFNREITQFNTDEENVKRIIRFMNKLEEA